MMRTFEAVFEKSRYVFNPYLGWLFKRRYRRSNPPNYGDFSSLEEEAWQAVQDPFRLATRELSLHKAMPSWHESYNSPIDLGGKTLLPSTETMFILEVEYLRQCRAGFGGILSL